MEKLRRNKRGVSPVLSTLLMIIVAVAASLVTYAWVMGYIGFTTAKTGKAIMIQSVANDAGDLKIYVQNVGDSPVSFNNDQSFYVNGTLQTATFTPSTLNAHETTTITTTINVPAGTENTKIKVTALDGTFTEFSKTW